MQSARFFISLCVAGAIGLGTSFSFPPALLLMALVPAIAGLQSCRGAAFASAFAYYFAASWPLTTAAQYFFGPDVSAFPAILLWIGSSSLLALPWAGVWTADRRQYAWRIPIAQISTVLPPIGLIGWAHPLTSAGLLFPGTAWVGLAATILGPALVILYPRTVLLVALAGGVTANCLYRGTPHPPSSWEAIDTVFGSLSEDKDSSRHEFAAARSIQDRALQSTRHVIIFPETVVPMWTEATELFWQQTLDELRASGKTILFGAGVPRQDRERTMMDLDATLAVLYGNRPLIKQALPRLNETPYLNTVLVRGAETGRYSQRVPVPVGMWKPFGSGGVPLNAFGPAVLTVRGQRTSILICYEVLIAWPILQSMAASPSVVLALANDHWAQHDAIPRYQRTVLTVWSRLFGVPHLSAINH
jgi:predicted amidohydrolase